jgi:outer membrane protein assembly factor BamB
VRAASTAGVLALVAGAAGAGLLLYGGANLSMPRPDPAAAADAGAATAAQSAPTTPPAAPSAGVGTAPPAEPVPTPAVTADPDPPPPVDPPWVDPASVGQPYGTAVRGLLTFRGNPTRTYYGGGPVPRAPEVAWRYPARGALCGLSTVGQEEREWCGTGWTGQPAVFERDGRTWVVFGAYDHRIHFLDAATGEPLLPSLVTGDLVKGSVTVDPDGYPLVYSGSRDGYYRVIAIDGDEPVELWRLWAHDVAPTMWNDDWDGSGLVLDDHLLIGGENSRWHVVRLHRGYDAQGRVVVDPELIFDAAGWDDELLAAVGDRNVSIEGSVTVVGDVLYFANSGGLVQGWDLAGLRAGRRPERVFRFWTGDDTDATVVADEDGMLYVASQFERLSAGPRARAREVGQIIKLDPSRPDDPLVWSVADQGAALAGVWATPALHRDVLYVPTHGGQLLAIGRHRGEVRWRLQLQGPTWQSPVVVDDVLIQGDCSGTLRAYDVSDTRSLPAELWALRIGGCIESTPAVWDGGVYVGTRAGWFVALRDP